MEYHLFNEPATNFYPTVEVSGCYLEYQNKILLLRRHAERPQGGTWGVPAGKLEKGETSQEALIREVFEEIGFNIQDQKIEEIGKLFIRLPHVDYVYHMFFVLLRELPHLHLELTEHEELRWVNFSEALQVPLVTGGKEGLEHYQRFRNERAV
jgi:mutator protein MutT